MQYGTLEDDLQIYKQSIPDWIRTDRIHLAIQWWIWLMPTSRTPTQFAKFQKNLGNIETICWEKKKIRQTVCKGN